MGFRRANDYSPLPIPLVLSLSKDRAKSNLILSILHIDVKEKAGTR